MSELDRFRAKYVVDASTGCWNWTAATAGQYRYGVFYFDGRQGYAHRFAWLRFKGAIPDGHQVDHLCRNTLCVNPEHLEAVSPRTNTLRSTALSAQNARKTHCSRGHELSGVNLKTEIIRGKPARRCIECRNAGARRRRAA